MLSCKLLQPDITEDALHTYCFPVVLLFTFLIAWSYIGLAMLKLIRSYKAFCGLS